jgi:N-acetylglucosamine-6-phosphate deacetylase
MLVRNLFVQGYSSSAIKKTNALISDDAIQLLDHIEETHQSKAKKHIDAAGHYFLIPGQLDSHIHGYGGIDFADATTANLPQMLKALGETGLSYCMATIVSLPLPRLKAVLSHINAYVIEQEKNPTPGATKIVGVHLEGPFIEEKCCGAHQIEALQKKISLALFKEIIAAAPSITQWKITLAPNLDGAKEFIDSFKQLEMQGIFVSVFLGHCNPDIKCLDDAFDFQFSQNANIQTQRIGGFTHLGNACGESNCRDHHFEKPTSNLVNWAINHLSSFDLNHSPCVELIVDNVHLSPSFVKFIFEKVGDRIILVSDRLGPSGLRDGSYKLGDLPIIKDGENFYLADFENPSTFKLVNGSKKLAGSAASMNTIQMNYVNILLSCGFTHEQALHSLYLATVANARRTSLSPAAIQQLPDNQNFIIMDRTGKTVMSMCNGIRKEWNDGLNLAKNLRYSPQGSGIYRTFIGQQTTPDSSPPETMNYSFSNKF